MTPELKNKVERALSVIQGVYATFGSRLFVGHSGGKDSTVILSLTTQVFPEVKLVHNVKPMLGTSADPLTEMYGSTLEFMYTHVCRQHQTTFLHSSSMKNFVERNGLQCQIDGSRIEEYSRAGKSSEFIKDGKSVSRLEMVEVVPNGIFGLTMVYPILDWTSNDVFDYLSAENLDVSREYETDSEYLAWEAETGLSLFKVDQEIDA